jgi:hypothetical protein
MSTIKANAYLDAAGGNTATVNGAVPAPATSPTLTTPIISGNLGAGGASYGTAGQVLVSGGVAANTLWASSQSIGIGQTWQDVTGSRVSGTSYQNTTGRPIMVYIMHTNASLTYCQVSTNNSTWIAVGNSQAANAPNQFIVPDQNYYRIAAGTFGQWSELR